MWYDKYDILKITVPDWFHLLVKSCELSSADFHIMQIFGTFLLLFGIFLHVYGCVGLLCEHTRTVAKNNVHLTYNMNIICVIVFVRVKRSVSFQWCIVRFGNV